MAPSSTFDFMKNQLSKLSAHSYLLYILKSLSLCSFNIITNNYCKCNVFFLKTKKEPPAGEGSLRRKTSVLAITGSVAISAVYRSVIAGLEWYFCVFSTFGTYGGIQGTGTTVAPSVAFSCLAAALTANRLVFKAFFAVEFLLCLCEHKISATVFACNCFVCHFFLDLFRFFRNIGIS